MNNLNIQTKRKTLFRLFPYISDKDAVGKLKIDDESIYYISIREYAEKILSIIKFHLDMINKNISSSIITDSTSGVGGDTISFAKEFKKVYSIEINEERYKILKNNTSVYSLKNIEFINNDCTKCITNIIDHDVVYIDPPWGGKGYKNHKCLRLNISNISIEQFCNNLMNSQIMKNIPNIIVLKLPMNYDIIYFYKNVNKKNIYHYDLGKMIILVIMVNLNT